MSDKNISCEELRELEFERERRESQLDSIGDVLGADAKEAMREYLSIFDDKFYIWLANLYDANTGALYYSNSARDNDGFLPDIESTTRGWNWLGRAGLLEKYDGRLCDALPERIAGKLVSWLKSLQSAENGYFYHPQWNGTETVSRLGRDLDCASNFINSFGEKPLYDTLNGFSGSLGAPTGVKATATEDAKSATPDHLRSPEALYAYLDALDWDNKSYSSGNRMESQATQIRNAGREFIETYESYMNARQERIQRILRESGRTPNGLWQTEVCFNSINGLMKITNTYTRLGIAIPYAREAFASALSMVTFDEADSEGKIPNAIVDVFNPWVSLNSVLSNITKFGEPAVAEELRTVLRSRAAELISVTARKVARFKKEDGSFGYRSEGGQASSQSMPVAVKGTNEGDVNGSTIAVSGILGNMCMVLGIQKPQLYFNSDFKKFMAEIERIERV